MVYIGIDPGFDGAVAFMPDNAEPHWVMAPTLPIVVAGKNRRAYDLRECSEIARRIADFPEPKRVWIENLHAFPGQGAQATFQLGRSSMVWEAMLTAHRAPWESVQPQRWKRAILGGLGKEKSATLAWAKAAYPRVNFPRNQEKAIGVADALGMAQYGRMMIGAEELSSEA
jgi:Holliday junction resolvasome RuvABC endonuclease subunit